MGSEQFRQPRRGLHAQPVLNKGTVETEGAGRTLPPLGIVPVPGLVRRVGGEQDGRAKRPLSGEIDPANIMKKKRRVATKENATRPRSDRYPARGTRVEQPTVSERPVELGQVTIPDTYAGKRNRLNFYQNVRESMALLPYQCVECGGDTKLAIDHVRPISNVISDRAGALREEYCDGQTHWSALPFEAAMSLYNAEIDPDAAASEPLVSGKFQWLCGRCNSSKGGGGAGKRRRRQERNEYGEREVTGACPNAGDAADVAPGAVGLCEIVRIGNAASQRRNMAAHTGTEVSEDESDESGLSEDESDDAG